MSVELIQNVQIVKIPHTGVGSSAGDNSFQLLRQNCFQIVRPYFNHAIFQHQLETVPDFSRSNGIAGGNVDLQRCNHMVKLCFHADPDTGIFRFIHDLGNALYPEIHAIINRHRNDGGNHILHFLNADSCAFDGCIHVHGGTGIQAHHGSYQHTAF
mgnify:CR=1 FL=1